MNVAFKEWSIICDTLGCGKQSLILRKGGIHEGKKGFRFEKFALFPTRFHEQEERVRIDSEKLARPKTEYQIGEIVPIQYWARIDSIWHLSQWKSIKALNEYHIWDEQIILDRYNWGKEKNTSKIPRCFWKKRFFLNHFAKFQKFQNKIWRKNNRKDLQM